MTSDQIVQEGIGYSELGMFEQAESLLQSVPKSDHDAYVVAQRKLLFLSFGKRDYESVAAIGHSLILQNAHDHAVVLNTHLALFFLGRANEAREVLAKMEDLSSAREPESYQMSCLESVAGNFPAALRWLELECRRSTDCYGRFLCDADLFGLWSWMGKKQFSLEDSHRILRMPFAAFLNAALDPATEPQFGENDFAFLPSDAPKLLRFNLDSGLFEFDPMAVAKHPEKAATLRELRQVMILAFDTSIKAGCQQALKNVINAQPRYAAAHAQWGNHTGVRHHLVWALAQAPGLIDNFRAEPGLKMMTGLLGSVAAAQAVDPDFCRRMEVTGALLEPNLDEAWKTLATTPSALRFHPLYTLREAGLFKQDEDLLRAVPLYLQLCQIWPNDVAAFANATDCLMGLGKWEAAEQVFGRAPACYQRFHRFHEQKTQLERQEFRCVPTAATQSFCGQPDLGGLLIEEGQSTAASLYEHQ